MAKDGGKYRLLRVEALEPRTLLDGVAFTNAILYQPGAGGSAVTPANTGTNPYGTPGFCPQQIWTAYGISSIRYGSVVGNGAGQTIGIIDAYNDPNIISDVATFSTEFGLPQFNVGGPTFQVLSQTGTTTLPGNAAKTGLSLWGPEISLDVEWAHAIAPQANIILFEATSSTNSNLFTAVTTAGSYCSVVSMSWGGTETSGETSYDADMQHAGVTYLSSTGDNGAPGNYPGFSPYVIAVGGTTLTLNADNTWNNEVVWNDGTYATGGGQSKYESEPSYQELGGALTVQTTGKRQMPDVSFVGDENTGVSVVDTYDYGGWVELGGTSLSCPCWAGLIAIADQLRAVDQLGPLTTATALTAIYSEYSLSAPYCNGCFHDVTSGNNQIGSGTKETAGTGYDMCSGIGTPIANVLIPLLAPGQPDMAVSIGDSGGGSVTAGDTGDSYILSVSNTGWAASSGTVTLTTTVSTGLTITGVSGTGWTVTNETSSSATVTRSDALAAGASYQDVTLTFSVDSGASGFVSDVATVSGGGETNTANDNACDGDLVNPDPPHGVIVNTEGSGDVTPPAVSGVDPGTGSTPVVTVPGTPSSSGAAAATGPTGLPAAEAGAKEIVSRPVFVTGSLAAPLVAATGPSLAATEDWATPGAGSQSAQTVAQIRAHDAVLQSQPDGSSLWEATPLSGTVQGRGRRHSAWKSDVADELVVTALAELLS